MLGPVAPAEAIRAVLLAKDLRDVPGDEVDDCLHVGLVEPVAVRPAREIVRIDEPVVANLAAVTLDARLD